MKDVKAMGNLIRFICVIMMLTLLTFFVAACSSNNTETVGKTEDSRADTAKPDVDEKETEPEKQEKESEIKETEPELEFGFFYPYDGCAPERLPALAYTSDTKEFDPNDVIIRIYYGYAFNFSEEYARENYGFNCSEFKIYCFNYDIYKDVVSNYHTLKNVSENIVSEKFRIKYKINDEGAYFNFNCSEEFTIPADVFCEERGQLYIGIGGVNLKKYGGPEYEVIDFKVLNYVLEDSKVILTPYN